jgi:hypothetical protein
VELVLKRAAHSTPFFPDVRQHDPGPTGDSAPERSLRGSRVFAREKWEGGACGGQKPDALLLPDRGEVARRADEGRRVGAQENPFPGAALRRAPHPLRADALRDLSPVGERQVIPAVSPFLLPGEKVRAARMRGIPPAFTGTYPSP